MSRHARTVLATGAIAALAISGAALASSANSDAAGDRASESARSAGFSGRAALSRNSLLLKGVDVSRTPQPRKLLPLDINGKIPFQVLPLDAAGKIPANLLPAPSTNAATVAGRTPEQIQAAATAALQARQSGEGTAVASAKSVTLATLNLPSAGVYTVTINGNVSADSAAAGKVAKMEFETSVGSQVLGASTVDLHPQLVSPGLYSDADNYSATYVVTATGARTVTLRALNDATDASSATSAVAGGASITAVRVGSGTGAVALR